MLGFCNTANYNSDADWNGLDGNLTTVGSNGKSSYYGTFDQTGNINELLDTNNGNWKIFRGGSFLSSSGNIDKNYNDIDTIDLKRTDLGFRICKTANSLDTINYVLIEDISNSNDTNNIGRIDYTYQIKKYPVTNSEYTEFLNSVCKSTNGLSLWTVEMSDPSLRGGIDRIGSSPNFTYVAKTNMGNKPVNFINWFSAARFINWLHNGKPTGVPGNGTTEDGVYTLTNFIVSGSIKPLRNNTNSYWLPNENEWYKAAYYDGAGNYWTYATQSNSLPDSITSDNTGSANGTINSNNCITPTPTPSITITSTPTVTPSLSSTNTPTPTISTTPTRTPTISITPTITNSPSATTTKTPTRTIAVTPSVSPTNTITRTPTRSVTPTTTSSATPTKTATVTPTPSKTMVIPINIGQLIYQNNVYINDDIKVVYKGFNLQGKLNPDVSIVYESLNVSSTPTPTVTSSVVVTATPTVSVSNTNTSTPTPTVSISATTTPTITPTISLSVSPTVTPTNSITPSITQSNTPTVTPSITVTNTPTNTVTPSITSTVTPSVTISLSATPTVTPSVTNTTTPTNAVTPTPSTTPINNNILSVAFNSNKSAASQDNGSTWSINNMPSTKYWTSILKNNGTYITCAYNEPNIYLSNNGTSWTSYSLSNLSSSNNLWVNIIYGNNLYIITPNSSAVAGKSSDGINWSETYLPAYGNWKAGSYGNNSFLTAAENSSVSATSTNGITWTQRTLPSSSTWVSSEYLNNLFFLIAKNSNILIYSIDAINWTTITLPVSGSWVSLAYDSNIYLLLASDGTILKSSDLITWNSSNLPFGTWNKIKYQNNFIAIGTNLAYTSTDGLLWTQRNIGNYNWMDLS